MPFMDDSQKKFSQLDELRARENCIVELIADHTRHISSYQAELFRVRAKICDIQVSLMPEWKRNILQDSSSPTVRVPRQPVDNE